MNLLPCQAAGDRLTGDAWALPNPGYPTTDGRPLTLGVRPEDLSLDRHEPSASLPATVYATEPLGDRTLVDVEVGGHRLQVKAPPRVAYEVGERVVVGVELDRIHLFDAETEAAIAR